MAETTDAQGEQGRELTGALRGSRIHDADLSGSRFRGCDLSEMVMRGVSVAGTEIDDPWLLESGDSTLVVNGVDVAPFVDAELNRRFPGRELRRAEDPEQLQAAWAALQRTWDATVRRAQDLPEGAVDRSVDGEWSFSQTLRHLLLATDMWLGKAVLDRPDPFHPLGLLDEGTAGDGRTDTEGLTAGTPPFRDVLTARAEHVEMVRTFLAEVTPEQLAQPRPNPHAPEYSESVLSCLRTIIEEEWEHHRFAVRDLDAIDAGAGQAQAAAAAD